MLKLSEPEEGEPPTLIGRLYHKVLEIATQHATGDPDLRQGILDALEWAFEEGEHVFEKMARVRGWQAWRGFYLAQLRRTVTSEGFAQPRAQVVETEAGFSGEWHGFRALS